VTDRALTEALTADMAEPWWRDLLIQTIADHRDDLDDWSKHVVETYGRSGSIEVAACILALRARAFGPTDREAGPARAVGTSADRTCVYPGAPVPGP
jgi:hypothetical protein